jgi:hypothetical protein
MLTSTIDIKEFTDTIVVDGIEIPRMKKGKLNIYNSKQINAVGGIESFLDIIGSDKPIEIPPFDFTEKEILEMDELMKED